MKKLLLIFFLLPLAFSACSSDDDSKEEVTLTKDLVVGTWNITQYATDGSYQDAPSMAIFIQLKSDNSYFIKFLTNTYIGTYTISGNTVKGVTTDPITEYFKFESLEGKKAEISYSNSDGGKYKFKATKE